MNATGTDGQEAHEKMLDIINYQRGTDQHSTTYHLTLVRMATIKMSRNNKCWRECGVENPPTLMVGM